VCCGVLQCVVESGHSHVWRGSFPNLLIHLICSSNLARVFIFRICDMTWYMWRDICIGRVTSIDTCDMTYEWIMRRMRHGVRSQIPCQPGMSMSASHVTCINKSRHMYKRVMSQDVNESCHKWGTSHVALTSARRRVFLWYRWYHRCDAVIWGGYGYQDRLNYSSLLQNIVSFIGLFCKRDLQFDRSY